MGPPQGVYVPEMYEDMTTERVLMMEWLDGTRLRSAGDLSSGSQPRNPDDLRLVEVR